MILSLKIAFKLDLSYLTTSFKSFDLTFLVLFCHQIKRCVAGNLDYENFENCNLGKILQERDLDEWNFDFKLQNGILDK